MKRLSTLQYISDIHLEYLTGFPKIPVKGESLALLGDIGNPFKDNYKEFLKYTSNNWDSVLLLTGNHEYWNLQKDKYNMDDVDNKIRDIITRFPNVTFLNNNKYEFLNYTILGTTLWSSINKISSKHSPVNSRHTFKKMGDDLYISPENTISCHNNAVKWLEKEIKSNDKHNNKKIIVLSHHLPSYKLIIDKYRKDRYLAYHDRFASHLDYLMQDPVKAWLCGHSHSVNEISINGVYCAINAYGYNNSHFSSQSLPLPIRVEKVLQLS
jgi:predicted phosphohydrolase